MTAVSAPAADDTRYRMWSPVAWIRRWLVDATPLDLALRASIVMVVVVWYDRPGLLAPTSLAAILILCIQRLRHNPIPWFAIGISFAIWQAPKWYTFDNHEWFATYWLLAVGLSLTAPDRQRALAVNGRLMIGLIFALAAAWKLVSVEFMSGDFFHHSLLVDPRFSFLPRSLGQLDEATRAANHMAIMELPNQPGQWVQLQSTDLVRRIAIVFSLWGAFIETAIAVTWLFPLRRRIWLRHLSLLAFMVTTYLVVPVEGFGCMLIAMALTQSESVGKLRYAYVGGFALLFAYSLFWTAHIAP